MAETYFYCGTPSFANELEVENPGEVAIEANNDEGLFWYLIIRTKFGTTSIATCGPVIPDVELLPNDFSETLTKMDYNERKINLVITKFLNDFKKKITKAEVVEIDYAIKQVRDFQSYLEAYGEDVY